MIRSLTAVMAAGALAFGAVACGDDDDEGTAGGGGDAAAQSEELSGSIQIDGSSTVAPFAQAAAELFNEEQPNVRITVGTSGTGGGFEKFCAGETDISDASRPIKEDEEVPVCEENGIEYDQISVANDGISVVTNPGLEVDCLTVDQLKQIWDKGSKVDSLSDVDPQLPDARLSLYGPGTDSGTFDFFTDEVNGEEGRTRADYEASEDDNVLVTGISQDEGGLGYLGFSYYEENQDKLGLVGVAETEGGECVKPSTETIQNGTYKPLGRQIFMYPSAQALARPEVQAFMQFVLENNDAIAEAAQIVPLTEEQIAEERAQLDTLTSGGGAAGGSTTTTEGQ